MPGTSEGDLSVRCAGSKGYTCLKARGGGSTGVVTIGRAWLTNINPYFQHLKSVTIG